MLLFTTVRFLFESFYFVASFFGFVIFLTFDFFSLESDYYYGGSMRDLSGRHTGRRKSSSASHLGEPTRPI